MTIKRSAKDFFDFDYLETLSDADREWLLEFSFVFYNQATSKKASAVLKKLDPDTRRALWGNDNARRRDIWNNRQRVGLDEVYKRRESDEKEEI